MNMSAKRKKNTFQIKNTRGENKLRKNCFGKMQITELYLKENLISMNISSKKKI